VSPRPTLQELGVVCDADTAGPHRVAVTLLVPRDLVLDRHSPQATLTLGAAVLEAVARVVRASGRP
jgi:hypothetical protein